MLEYRYREQVGARVHQLAVAVGGAGAGSSTQKCRRGVWAAVAYRSAEPVQQFGKVWIAY